ncbi:hypothetical protein GCM10010300_32780 [Streptomyces olivaceoviridis]|nr:hypothetical protein GCM10010300_32780 [Streptomyces olivaceoviridis]
MTPFPSCRTGAASLLGPKVPRPDPCGPGPPLMRLAREVAFETGTRLFEEGRPAVIETLGHGEPVGWS